MAAAKTWAHFPEWHYTYISYLLWHTESFIYRNNDNVLFCHTSQTLELSCKKIYESTSDGMGVAGVLNIVKCSLHTQGICYTKYLGDRDSKAYQKMVAEKLCGPKIPVTKLEYLSHVHKKEWEQHWRELWKKRRVQNFTMANLFEAEVTSLSLKYENCEIIMG